MKICFTRLNFLRVLIKTLVVSVKPKLFRFEELQIYRFVLGADHGFVTTILRPLGIFGGTTFCVSLKTEDCVAANALLTVAFKELFIVIVIILRTLR